MPRVISVIWDVDEPNASTAKTTAFSGSTCFPQVYMSRATYPNSGQVWVEMWDSEITTTPEPPGGGNRLKEIDQPWAPAISAALTRICWTFSTLPMILGSQPEASTI